MFSVTLERPYDGEKDAIFIDFSTGMYETTNSGSGEVSNTNSVSKRGHDIFRKRIFLVLMW